MKKKFVLFVVVFGQQKKLNKQRRNQHPRQILKSK